MKKVAVLVVAVAGMLVLAAPASAAPHFDSTVTINFTGDQYGGAFFGAVSSEKNGCVKDRKVKVKATDPYGGASVGKDKTDLDGQYSIAASSVPEADYLAVAKKKKVKKNNGKTKFVCDKAVSSTIHAP